MIKTGHKIIFSTIFTNLDYTTYKIFFHILLNLKR
nr:MAG TPA: hypothetical protein [Caudoviricetes sp.]